MENNKMEKGGRGGQQSNREERSKQRPSMFTPAKTDYACV